MSVWTHITGNIRIDGAPGLTKISTVEALKKVLGNTCSFDDDEAVWDACNVPKGSEGSLQYEVIEYGDGLLWVTVAVWGDLRDYDFIAEIKAWFERILCAEGLIVRQAVLSVSVENGREVIYYAAHDDDYRTEVRTIAITEG